MRRESLTVSLILWIMYAHAAIPPWRKSFQGDAGIRKQRDVNDMEVHEIRYTEVAPKEDCPRYLEMGGRFSTTSLEQVVQTAESHVGVKYACEMSSRVLFMPPTRCQAPKESSSNSASHANFRTSYISIRNRAREETTRASKRTRPAACSW